MLTKLKNMKWITLFCALIMAVLIPCRGNSQVRAENVVDPMTIATSEGGEELDPGLEGEESGTPDYKTPEELFKGFPISTTSITDECLYSSLLNLYKDTYRGTDRAYSGSVIYSDMFKDFTSINVDNEDIDTLNGLEKLELDNLESFSANLNNISNFDSDFFVKAEMDKLTSLSLSGNRLNSIDLTGFDSLTYIDLSANELGKLDLSMIEGKTMGSEVEINVAGNKFSAMKNITLPDKRIGHITLNIIDNNITEIPDEFFTNRYTMKIGVQGFKPEDKEVVKSDTLSNFKIYKMGIENLALEVYKIDGEEDVLVQKITDEDIADSFLKLNLPVGEYEYIYTINGEPAFSRYDVSRVYLDSYKFGIIPQKALYNFTYKGKIYNTLNKVTGKVTVNLSTQEEGAKIFYSVNGGDWVEGDTVLCDDGGNYSIKVKTVINGFESEEQSVWVRTSLNLYISDAVMLLLVVLLTLALFFVVLPIISKKYFKKD